MNTLKLDDKIENEDLGINEMIKNALSRKGT
jgi:hypothetical protein